MLPSISLTAGLNYISSDILVLNNRDNPAWSIGAKLLAPLYRGGALEAQVEVRTAEQKEALAAYAQTGLKAFSEVENSLSSEFAMREREAILGEGAQHNQRALDLEQARYKVGARDFRSVHPTAARPLFRAHGTAAGASEQRVQRVNLHLALGGGFGETARFSSANPDAIR